MMKPYIRRTALFCVSAAILNSLAALRAAAGVAAQCEVADGAALTDGAGHVLAWNALRGGAAFVPALAGSPAWALPVLEPGGVAFGGAEIPASPLSAETAAPVATLFIVARPGPAEDRFSALVEVPGASVTVVPRIAQRTYDPEDAAGLSVRVNGAPGLAFPAAPHIVEVDFPRPVPGDGLRIGGASACAGWNQAWRGHVGAVIAFDAPPPEAVRRVVRSYLARRHGVPGVFPPPGREAVFQAQALGLNTHSLFATTLILK